MHILAWPEAAQREWFTHFVQTLQMGLGAHGESYMGSLHVKQVVGHLMGSIPFGFDWPTRYENDKEICRLRFVDEMSGIALHEYVKDHHLDTEHKRVTHIDQAWTATFQTAIQALRSQKGHPLRKPVYNALMEVRPVLARKLIPTRSHK